MVGIVSESDLILSEEEEDLHLPHYLNIMGGIVFVGSMKGFEERLNKAFATNVRDLMTADPVVAPVDDDAESGGEEDRRVAPQPPARGRRRGPPRRHGHPGRRAGRARRRVAMARAVARIDLGAVERNCAHLKATVGDGRRALRGGQGRRLRPRRRRLRRRPRSPAARPGWRSRPAPRRPQIGRRFPHVPLLTMGALTAEELDAALAAGSEVAVWHEEFRALARRPRPRPGPARRASTSSTTAAWAGSATATPGRCSPWPAPAPRTRDLELAGVWTHFATADEPDSEFFDEQLEPLRGGRRGGQGRVPRGHRPRREQRRRLPRAARPLRHGPLRRRRLRARPLPGRPRRARPRPALSLRSYVADVKRFGAGGQRRLRADVAGGGRDQGRRAADRLRRRGAARPLQQRRGAGPRPPPSAGRHGLDGQRDDRPRRRRPRSSRATRRC